MPRGGVWGVPPAVWQKAVERLHGHFISRPPTTLLWAPCCSLLGPGTGYVTHGLPLGTPFLCPPCHPRACCQLLCQGCPGCCPLAGPTWWPLSRTLGATAREQPEAELKPKVQPLPLEAPKKEKVAVQAPVAVSSSSSSSFSEGDLEKDLETGLPQRLVVDSTVTSDPVPPEKTRRRQAGLGQPEWRYWRRNGPEPLPGKPGTPSSEAGPRALLLPFRGSLRNLSRVTTKLGLEVKLRSVVMLKGSLWREGKGRFPFKQ